MCFNIDYCQVFALIYVRLEKFRVTILFDFCKVVNSLTLSPTYSPPNSHSQVRQLTNKLDFLKAQLSAEQATANDMRGVSEMAEIKVRAFQDI